METNRLAGIMKKLLTYLLLLLTINAGAQVMTGIMASSGQSGTALTTGLISSYECNESSGTVVDEVSAYNSTASTANYSASGKLGTALSFSAADDYVTLSQGAAFATTHTGDVSIFAWIYLVGDNVGYGNIFGNYYGPQFYLSEIGSETAYLRWYVGGGAQEAADVFAYNTWHHVGIVKTGVNVQFYHDGIPLGSVQTESAYDASNTIYMGGDPEGEYVNGRVDLVRYWSRALSSTEVANLYTKENSGTTYPW
jgi:hypothetical protein